VRSLTIVVPALNEEKKIGLTIAEIIPAARRLLDRFEVIAVNDGSTDQTAAILGELARSYPELHVIHNPERRGVGWAFWEAIGRSTCDYLTVVPGDHAYHIEGLERLLESVGSADVVVSYRTNQFGTRQKRRVILSKTYQRLIGLIFGFKLRDFHSTVVYPVLHARTLHMVPRGYTYQLEALIRLLRRGLSYRQIPVRLNPSGRGTSHALHPKTFYEVMCAIWRLLRN
jgi:dolichol-phosphate mannosyltransferase